MKQIIKKVLPKYFEQVIMGNKNFELRKDDDDVQVGDVLILEEWAPNSGRTGNIAVKTVTYVLRHAQEYGLMDGHCIIGF